MPISRLSRLDASSARLAHVRLGFVGGQGKSGTTWVERLLDAHPDAVCLGEGHFAEGLGRRLYAALSEYNQHVAQNNAKFPELERFPPLADEDASELARAALLLQFDRIAARKPGAKVVAVRTPSELDWIPELIELFPDARFVQVLRDPRDIAVSLWWHRERLGPGSMTREYGTVANLAQHLVPRWAAQVVRVHELAQRSGAALHDVVYERLLADPKSEADALFTFFELASDAAKRDAALSACRFESLSGGRAPGDLDPSSHFRSGTAGQWRGQMPAAPAGGWSTAVIELLDSLGFELL